VRLLWLPDLVPAKSSIKPSRIIVKERILNVLMNKNSTEQRRELENGVI
jgi:hypothetical protein